MTRKRGYSRFTFDFFGFVALLSSCGCGGYACAYAAAPSSIILFGDDAAPIGDVYVVDAASEASDSFGIKTYFRNLTDYSPKNLGESCGFVALSQYLSYWDNFYNDAIIPSEYERKQTSQSSAEAALAQSPGVLRSSADGYDSVADYVEASKSYDYQAHLLAIYNQILGASDSNYVQRTNMSYFQSVLDVLFGENAVTFDYIDSTEFGEDCTPIDEAAIVGFNEYVKMIVNREIPVILSIAKVRENENGELVYENGHFVVAYYYDDGVHVHLGLGDGEYNDVVLDPTLYQIVCAGFADFSNISFSHSDNYLIDGVGYCGCGEHVIHSRQSCVAPLTSASGTHTCRCACGHSWSEGHYTDGSTYSASGYPKCVACGAVRQFMPIVI